MEPRNCEVHEAPILIGELETNRKLINECLAITNDVYATLTSDVNPNRELNEPSCIMGDVMGQTQDLRVLLDLLLAIKKQIR